MKSAILLIIKKKESEPSSTRRRREFTSLFAGCRPAQAARRRAESEYFSMVGGISGCQCEWCVCVRGWGV